MSTAQTNIPDVPEFIGTVEDYAEYYSVLKLRQRTLLKQQLELIRDNIIKYSRKRAPISKGSKIFKKILKDARFIPAHPSRYVSGFDLENVQYFILHRPSTNSKASTLENIILTFAQYEHEKAAKMHGYCPSTHFAVGQRGELIQFVDLADRTFHVGVGNYNYKSIGVEIEGAVGTPLSIACYTTLAKLLLQLRILCPKLVLDSEHVLEHRLLEPQRKTDVGAPFLFSILQEYIERYSSLITNVEFVEYSEEDVMKSLSDTIVELSAYGNTLAGVGKEVHRKLVAAFDAEAKRRAAINASRSTLSKNNLIAQEKRKQQLLYVQSRRARVFDGLIKPISVVNGAGVRLRDV